MSAKKILVVEDSLYQRKNIVKNLSEWGHHVEQAGNGVEALKVLESYTPDVILSDLLMPEMDGFGLLEKLREKGSKIPVVVLSADIQSSVRDQCSGLGAKDFLSKPVDKVKLKQCLVSILGAF